MKLDSSVRSSLALVPCLVALGACSGEVSSAASSGSSTSGAAAGAYPASAPDNPQVVDLGGPRLTTPRIVAFYDPDDADAKAALGFVKQLGASQYWAQTVGEYGIGAIAEVFPVPVPGGFPVIGSSSQAAAFLAPLATSYLASSAGAPEEVVLGGTLYRYDTLFLALPPTAVACGTFDGNHGALLAGDATVPWALAQRCPDSAGELSPIEHTIAILTHEVVDASTCPFDGDAGAWAGVDSDHLAWTTDGFQRISTEVAHLCDSNRVAATVGGETVTLEEVWSNSAAAAGHHRCAPLPPGGGPEVLGVPALTEEVPFTASQTTRGVQLAQGQSTTIEVHLVSDAPTGGPFFLEAVDVAASEGMPPELALSLDRVSGQNGDVAHLTITRLRAPEPLAPVNGVVFELRASLSPSFSSTHASRGFVANGPGPLPGQSM